MQLLQLFLFLTRFLKKNYHGFQSSHLGRPLEGIDKINMTLPSLLMTRLSLLSRPFFLPEVLSPFVTLLLEVRLHFLGGASLVKHGQII